MYKYVECVAQLVNSMERSGQLALFGLVLLACLTTTGIIIHSRPRTNQQLAAAFLTKHLNRRINEHVEEAEGALMERMREERQVDTFSLPLGESNVSITGTKANRLLVQEALHDMRMTTQRTEAARSRGQDRLGRLKDSLKVHSGIADDYGTAHANADRLHRAKRQMEHDGHIERFKDLSKAAKNKAILSRETTNYAQLGLSETVKTINRINARRDKELAMSAGYQRLNQNGVQLDIQADSQ